MGCVLFPDSVKNLLHDRGIAQYVLNEKGGKQI